MQNNELKQSHSIIVDLIQGSREWHLFRKSHIGASDTPIILGASPWSTPHKLWMNKMSEEVEMGPISSAMFHGIKMEEEARKSCCEHLGIEFIPQVRACANRPWMSASFDGVNDQGNIFVEIKCPYSCSEDHKMAKEGRVPSKYFPQLQHQMYVLGTDFGYYWSYYKPVGEGKADTALVRVIRDEVYIQNSMLPSLEKFWELMLTFQSPPITWKDYKIREDQEWKVNAYQYNYLSEKILEMEDKRDLVKKELIRLSNGENVQGGGIKLIKKVVSGRIDYKSIPELEEVDLENYRKPSCESWSIYQSK